MITLTISKKVRGNEIDDNFSLQLRILKTKQLCVQVICNYSLVYEFDNDILEFY